MSEAVAPATQIARLEYVIRAQMAKIDELRGEIKNLVEWINGDRDALTCLQRTYNDPKTSEGNRIKAASAAIAFERPKLTVSVQVGPSLLGERLDRMKMIEPKVIDHDPLPPAA